MSFYTYQSKWIIKSFDDIDNLSSIYEYFQILIYMFIFP